MLSPPRVQRSHPPMRIALGPDTLTLLPVMLVVLVVRESAVLPEASKLLPGVLILGAVVPGTAAMLDAMVLLPAVLPIPSAPETAVLWAAQLQPPPEALVPVVLNPTVLLGALV